MLLPFYAPSWLVVCLSSSPTQRESSSPCMWNFFVVCGRQMFLPSRISNMFAGNNFGTKGGEIIAHTLLDLCHTGDGFESRLPHPAGSTWFVPLPFSSTTTPTSSCPPAK